MGAVDSTLVHLTAGDHAMTCVGNRTVTDASPGWPRPERPSIPPLCQCGPGGNGTARINTGGSRAGYRRAVTDSVRRCGNWPDLLSGGMANAAVDSTSSTHCSSRHPCRLPAPQSRPQRPMCTSTQICVTHRIDPQSRWLSMRRARQSLPLARTPAPSMFLPASGCLPRSARRRLGGDAAPWTVAAAMSQLPRGCSVAALRGPASGTRIRGHRSAGISFRIATGPVGTPRYLAVDDGRVVRPIAARAADGLARPAAGRGP